MIPTETRAKTERPIAETELEGERPGYEECPLKAWATALRDLPKGLHGLLPEEFWHHRRAAKREVLLALRSLLDAAIERLEEKPPATRRRKAPAKIAVQR